MLLLKKKAYSALHSARIRFIWMESLVSSFEIFSNVFSRHKAILVILVHRSCVFVDTWLCVCVRVCGWNSRIESNTYTFNFAMYCSNAMVYSSGEMILPDFRQTYSYVASSSSSSLRRLHFICNADCNRFCSFCVGRFDSVHLSCEKKCKRTLECFSISTNTGAMDSSNFRFWRLVLSLATFSPRMWGRGCGSVYPVLSVCI